MQLQSFVRFWPYSCLDSNLIVCQLDVSFDFHHFGQACANTIWHTKWTEMRKVSLTITYDHVQYCYCSRFEYQSIIDWLIHAGSLDSSNKTYDKFVKCAHPLNREGLRHNDQSIDRLHCHWNFNRRNTQNVIICQSHRTIQYLAAPRWATFQLSQIAIWFQPIRCATFSQSNGSLGGWPGKIIGT